MENLSLVAGLIASDGHLDKDYHAIRYVTADKEMLAEFVKLTRSFEKKDLECTKWLWIKKVCSVYL